MVHLEPERAHDVEAMPHHEVIDRRDGPRRRVFDGQDAVGAKALLHRLEHGLEAVEVEDGRQREHERRRLLRVGALGARARDDRTIGEADALGCGGADAVHQRRLAGQHRALARLGDAEERAEEEPRPVLVFRTDRRRHARKDVALAGRVGHGRAALELGGRHLADDLQPPLEEPRQLAIDAVDLLADAADVLHASTSRALAMRAMVLANISGVWLCAPSQRACGGSLCTSMMRPSAPIAVAATDTASTM